MVKPWLFIFFTFLFSCVLFMHCRNKSGGSGCLQSKTINVPIVILYYAIISYSIPIVSMLYFLHSYILKKKIIRHLTPVTSIKNSSFNDVNRRIAIATSTMSKLSSLWTSSRLSFALKMRLYNSLIISIITYSSASWILTKAQKKRLDAFNTKSLRRIVDVRWHDYVTNASILIRTGQPSLTTTIRKLRLTAFGHICRLQPGTQAIDILASTPPSTWHAQEDVTTPLGRPNRQTPRCP